MSAASTEKVSLDSINSKYSDQEEKILLDRLDLYYREIITWFFDKILPDFQPNKILEIGSGTGHLLNVCDSKLTSSKAEFFGVDLSEYLVNNATKRFPTYNFATANGSDLPYPAENFDLVYSATVLGHVPQPLDILKEMVRVTKKGGKIAVLDQDFETAVLYPGDKELTRSVLNAAADYWCDGWIGRHLPTMLKNEGLTDIKVEAFVRIDRNFEPSFFSRIRDWVIEYGLPEEKAHLWFEQLCENADKVEFLFTRNFYAVTGIK